VIAGLVFNGGKPKPPPVNPSAQAAQAAQAAAEKSAEVKGDAAPAKANQKPPERFADVTPSQETLDALAQSNPQEIKQDAKNGGSGSASFREVPSAIAGMFTPPEMEGTKGGPLGTGYANTDEESMAGMPYTGPIRRKAPVEIMGVFGSPETMRTGAASTSLPGGEAYSQGPRVAFGDAGSVTNRNLVSDGTGDLSRSAALGDVGSVRSVNSSSEIPARASASTSLQKRFAPFGRLVKFRLVNTLDSLTPTNTPVIGLVTEPVFWNGQEIIPINTEVYGYVGSVPKIDVRGVGRLYDNGNWALVLPAQAGGKGRANGRELIVRGRALTRREAVTDAAGRVRAWEQDDLAPGLIGETISTLDNQEVRLFAATFLGAAAQATGQILQDREPIPGQAGANGLTQPKATAANALAGALGQGTAAAIDSIAGRIMDEIKERGFYVRVKGGSDFYLFVEQTIDPGAAAVGRLVADPGPEVILSNGGGGAGGRGQ
jgi:hypothetical protein